MATATLLTIRLRKRPHQTGAPLKDKILVLTSLARMLSTTLWIILSSESGALPCLTATGDSSHGVMHTY